MQLDGMLKPVSRLSSGEHSKSLPVAPSHDHNNLMLGLCVCLIQRIPAGMAVICPGISLCLPPKLNGMAPHLEEMFALVLLSVAVV